ncbi:MAG TPA: hypothetical protein VD997_09030 [Phycisphaerales bacterium]|nr:hypothetical protein [Phycisphaerales bacterium]
MEQPVPPPGESPIDPQRTDIDPVAFALSRTLCHLVWIDEHASDFARTRTSDPAHAEQELRYLLDSIPHALKHARRLRDLLLAGQTIDPAKTLPSGLAEQ